MFWFAWSTSGVSIASAAASSFFWISDASRLEKLDGSLRSMPAASISSVELGERFGEDLQIVTNLGRSPLRQLAYILGRELGGRLRPCAACELRRRHRTGDHRQQLGAVLGRRAVIGGGVVGGGGGRRHVLCGGRGGRRRRWRVGGLLGRASARSQQEREHDDRDASLRM